MRRRHLLLATALVTALAACGGGGSGGDAGGVPSATTAEASSELAFSAPTLDGGTFDFASLEGHDAVVWFWAPWCGSCAATAEGTNAVAAELGDQATFVGIGSQAEEDELDGFVDRFSLDAFPQVSDPDGSVWLRFADDVIRSSYLFIDDTGETSRTSYGELDEQQLRERVEALIAS